MNMHKVNSLLSTAIVSLTQREIEEAVAVGASSYKVPRPTKKGMPAKKRGPKLGSKRKSKKKQKLAKWQEDENILYDFWRQTVMKKKTMSFNDFLKKYGKETYNRFMDKEWIRPNPREYWIDIVLTVKGRMATPIKPHTEYFAGY